MTPRLALAFAALTAAPAFAAGLSMDMPNLTFPKPAPTLSTTGCQPDAPLCAPQP